MTIPVKLTDDNGEPIAAPTDITVKIKIESNDAFQYDYSLRTPIPLSIEKGETQTEIKLEIKTDEMIELNDESFTVTITSVEGAELDETKDEATYIIAGTAEEDLPAASPDGPRVDITWSNPDADINAILFKNLGETGQTSASVGFYSTNEDSESFVLEGKSDGSYFLNIERNDDVFGDIEATVLITQPDGTRMYRSFLVRGNKDVVDFVIVDGVYTFEFQF
ncbi:hypothetical protein ACU8V7_04620 [Zobellia nedashkovskayae]